MARRHWFIEGKYLGVSEAKRRWAGPRLIEPKGFHFFCPECGETWAHCPVDGQKHEVWSKPCSKHRWEAKAFIGTVGTLYPSEIAGSIILPWEREFVEEMPEAVVFREFLIHLRWGAESGSRPPGIASHCAAMLSLFSANK